MQYRNKKTGAVVTTNSVVKGEDWELIAPAPAPKKAEKQEKTPSKKKKVD